jgi:tRNA nucleotidyltransferase (CCA-adding enzyme)
METYLVGGAVRDELLGISNNKSVKDYVVVGSSPQEMKSLGYRQVGKNFPVFIDPDSSDEYALARIESKVGIGYSGFEFDTSKSVTLEQDLYRRDLTINAIARNLEGELIDPYGGLDDIKTKTIRHVSDAFSEDPVRLLRVARFASRFDKLGFNIAPETRKLMKQMVISGEVDALVPERVFKELSLALCSDKPSIFFDVLIESGAYHRLFPMLTSTGNHISQLVDASVEDLDVKFALWLHEQKLEDISVLCTHLKCPKDYQQIAELVAEWHFFSKHLLSHSAEEVLNFYLKTDSLRRQRRFEKILIAFKELGIDIKPISEILVALKTINVSKLDKALIVEQIAQKRLSVIGRFLNPTK